MLPVSTADEDFSQTIGASATESKYVFDEGEYPATCTNFEKGTTKKGDPKCVITFVGTGGKANGNEYKSHLSLSEAAQWKLLEVMGAFGIVMDANRNLPIKKSAIVGKQVTLVLAPEEGSNGKTYMQIQEILPGGAATAGPRPF